MKINNTSNDQIKNNNNNNVVIEKLVNLISDN